LVSKTPLEKIRSVALDNSSLTSAALLKVLFAKWWPGKRTFNDMVPDLERMLEHHDAALLIGDPALKVDRSKYETWDLAEEWIRFTGKPFVFAFWAVTQAAAERAPIDLAAIFQQWRDDGLEPRSLAAIAETWSVKLGVAEMDGIEDVTINIYYHLDAASLEGLQRFYRYGREYNVMPSVPGVNFADAKLPQL